MKAQTRLLKSLGKELFGFVPKVEHRKEKIIREYDIIKTPLNNLFAQRNIVSQTIEIFQEGAAEPTYVIPLVYLEDEYEFTKCKTCGNIAIFPKHGRYRKVICIKAPVFHEEIIHKS